MDPHYLSLRDWSSLKIVLKSSNRSKSARLVSHKSRIATLPIHVETKPWTSFSSHVTFSCCSNLAECSTQGRHGWSDHLGSTPPKSTYFGIKHFTLHIVQRTETMNGEVQRTFLIIWKFMAEGEEKMDIVLKVCVGVPLQKCINSRPIIGQKTLPEAKKHRALSHLLLSAPTEVL